MRARVALNPIRARIRYMIEVLAAASVYLDSDSFNAYAVAKFTELAPGGAFKDFVSWVVFDATALAYPGITNLNSDLAAGDQLTKAAFDAAAASYSL